jgi:hypothetical protein
LAARDWTTKYQAPARLEDLKSYNDDHGKVWLFNKAAKKFEWADPSQTGRLFESVNERILQTAALYGTKGGHIHANGLAMELYGSGLILGAVPGRGSGYWQADHAEYYSQPPAHNTVIVNGRSDYPLNPRSQIAMKLDGVEPASGEKGMSPDLGFAQASFHYVDPAADQQRTLALVQISPAAGFYCDVFRSRAENPAGSFHDYLSLNIGQSLVLADDAGPPLSLSASRLLGSARGCLKGYDYFKGEKSVEYSNGFSGVFSAPLPDGSRHGMRLWMPGQSGRRIFSVLAPGDHAIRDELPSFTELPMPTRLVRQLGEAWRRLRGDDQTRRANQ